MMAICEFLLNFLFLAGFAAHNEDGFRSSFTLLKIKKQNLRILKRTGLLLPGGFTLFSAKY